MSAFKPQQRHLALGGRVFHFVSYEAMPANARRQEEAQPAMWCLMVEGRRMPAVAWQADEGVEATDRRLEAWVAAHIAPVAPAPPAVIKTAGKTHRGVRGDWAP